MSLKMKTIDKLDIEVLGNLFVLANFSEKYSDYSISKLYDKFILMILNGSFLLIRDEKDELPIGFASWVFVDDIRLKELKNNKRFVQVDDFNTGNNLLFIEMFAKEEHYWDLFDYLTEYFNMHSYEIDINKIHTSCGMKINFDSNNDVLITREQF